MADSNETGSQRHAISCINCRTRKVKCDKVYPCGPCQKLQVDCNFRAKKARPKKSMVSKAKSGDINSRLDRLDQLVSKLGSLQGVQLPQDVKSLLTNSTPQDQSKKEETGPGTGKTTEEPSFGAKGMYPVLRSEFWMNLSDEVEGLRHTLCGESDDEVSDSSEAEDAISPPQSEATASGSAASFLFGRGGMGMQGRRHPNAAEVLRLSEAYFERVDTIFKFLHVPTVRILVGRVVAEGTRPNISKPEQALLFAMYFAAVNAMNDQEYALLQQDRRSALMYYKNCTESALADADLLCTTDLVTLQAFVIYLLALRSIDTSQATWSLIGLAIRLAQALDLHREIACTRIPPYHVQMRRRLYWVLGLMDVQAFQDRGLSPMMQSGTLFPQKPANVNDIDFGPETTEPITSRLTMTEMTVPLIAALTTETALQMVSRTSNSIQPDVKKVEEGLRKLHDNMSEHMQYFDMSLPICWFTKLVMRMALLKIWLVTHIPVHMRLRHGQAEINRRDIMIVCIASMELHLETQDREPMRRFAWYHANWHQWHPLAVCLAELIGTPTGELADRAWMTVSESFHKWKNNVADGRRGALWRPIRKLYEKAKRARVQALGGSYGTPSSDGASPDSELRIPQNLAEMGEERHRLHDAALRRVLHLGPNGKSPMIFLPDATNTPESLPDLKPAYGLTPPAPMMGVAGPTDPGPAVDPMNWTDWDSFLQETWETGMMGADLYDESLMEGIMNLPIEPPQIPQDGPGSLAWQQMSPSQQLQAAANREQERNQSGPSMTLARW